MIHSKGHIPNFNLSHLMSMMYKCLTEDQGKGWLTWSLLDLFLISWSHKGRDYLQPPPKLGGNYTTTEKATLETARAQGHQSPICARAWWSYCCSCVVSCSAPGPGPGPAPGNSISLHYPSSPGGLCLIPSIHKHHSKYGTPRRAIRLIWWPLAATCRAVLPCPAWMQKKCVH